MFLIRVVIVRLSNSKLSLVLKIRVLYALIFLFFGLHKICCDILCNFGLKLFLISVTHYLNDTFSWVHSDTLDVVTQVLKPKVAKLVKYWLGFFRERWYKMAAGNASTVSHWPRGVLEAIKECIQHRCNEWAEWLTVNFSRNFCAEFWDTVTSSLSNRVVICSWLRNIEFTNFFSILADNLSAIAAMNLLPCFIWINFDSLSDIIPIHAHSRNQDRVELCPKLVIFSCNVIERPSSMWCCITDLRPIISKTLNHNRY